MVDIIHAAYAVFNTHKIEVYFLTSHAGGLINYGKDNPGTTTDYLKPIPSDFIFRHFHPPGVSFSTVENRRSRYLQTL